MNVSIMQPYFLPYIGYWQLIANTNGFVFFDIVQYNKKSWMSRNRILHLDKNKEFQYISVPIKKHNKGTTITNVFINNDLNWKDEILGKLTVYKKLKALYYNSTINLVKSILKNNHDRLLSLSIKSVKEISEYLGIELKYRIAPDINFSRSDIKEPGDWALAIANKINANTYINPCGGFEIFDEDKYKLNGVTLQFLKSNLTSINNPGEINMCQVYRL